VTLIAENLAHIQDRISHACRRAGRDRQQVRLIAVSKKKPLKDIEAAATAGQIRFGESYVQELVEKVEATTRPLEWHFIGGLQSNKVKYLRGLPALIHSVDRLSLAEEISRQWQKIDQHANILLQFNLGGERSKSGAAAADALKLAQQVSQLPNLKVCGLMTLPPYFDDAEDVRPYFRQLRELADLLRKENLANVEMSELSMGMSHDFEVAIEEGATLVRVGSAIFGSRD
jgi:pyridoxal phosphate enzyme (YggS family)